MLEEIRSKVERLVALYEGQRDRADRLEAALSEAREQNENQRKQITELQREIDTLRLTQAFSPLGESSPETKAKLDKMIKEIDKCIAVLTAEE